MCEAMGGFAVITAVLVGLGHRSVGYAAYADSHPDELQIVGLAEPDDVRRSRYAERFGVAAENCFRNAKELAAAERFADVAINGTMDEIHVQTTIPLLEAGYDVLLEKPIAPNQEQLDMLSHAVERTGQKVVICHVLRYAPFYSAIKQRIANGEIGDIMHIHTTENVSYHHMAVAFIRGKWNREEINPMLLAKCCHDLDLICWMKSGIVPRKVASFGGRHFFTRENAPAGSALRCVDCSIERDCEYSAIRHHVDNKMWPFYALAGEVNYERGDVTDEVTMRAHVAHSEYGRCVWHCDNDVVDRQSVIIEFEDGCVATHDMVTNSAKGTRRIQITGTKGDIFGDMVDGIFTISKPGAVAGSETVVEEVRLNVQEDLHGGGDLRLVEDFLSVVKGDGGSISTTVLSDSINGHLIAYAADVAMREERVVTID
ncbi:MAG: Gfo/Idh/MocA family oxidoreductase [Candidatus Thalassarchaeaceae archaeon]|jgi:predicted dehydrogenase|nr:Gfo/Idh/MocA family oxidoreductase [Candidatus Thalassarchaeaceae archaeon]